MADKFSYVDSAGAKFEANDTPGNRAAVVAQGYKVDESILRTIGEAARGVDEAINAHPAVNYNPLTWVEHGLAKGIAAIAGAKPSEELPKYEGPAKGMFVYVDGDGAQHEARDIPENRKAVLEQGYKVPDLEALKAQNDPSIQGTRGAAKAYLENVGNEIGFGIPHMLDNKVEKEQHTALDAAHPDAAFAGSAAGVVANMLMPGVNLAGAAGKAGQAAEVSLGKLGVEGASLGGQVLQGAVREGVKGAVYAAPRAGGTLILQDRPEAAGEMLLAGVGIGALFGGGGVLASKAAGRLSEGVATGLVHVEDKLLSNPELGEKIREGIADKIAKGGGAAIGGAVGGWPGAYIGKGLGAAAAPAARKIVDVVADSEGVRKVAFGVARKISDGLGELPQVLANIGKGGVGGAAELTATNAAARLIGAPDDAPKEKVWTDLQTKVSRLGTDAEHRVDSVAKLAADLHGVSPAAVAQYNMGAHAVIDHLMGVMPKDPRAATLFAGAAPPWMPSGAEWARFGRHLQVVGDPFTPLKEMAKGTLTKEHMATFNAMFPTLSAEMKAQVYNVATSPNAPKLGKAQRAQVALFLGGQIDNATRPEAVASYQSVYAVDEEKSAPGKSIKVGGMPSVMTDTQRISMKAK